MMNLITEFVDRHRRVLVGLVIVAGLIIGTLAVNAIVR